MKIAKNWWLLTITGTLLTLLGFWVYSNPVENYVTLSVLFSVIILIVGIFEITFAITNSQTIKGWGWMLTSGFFDVLIGSILMTYENITMEILPFIFGIWLIFRGSSQFGRGILLKEAHLKNWGWPIFGGIFIVLFGLLVIFNPVFGALNIVIWTALSLILLGVFTVVFSFIIKKLND